MTDRVRRAWVPALLLALLAGQASAGTWKVGRDSLDCDGRCDFHDFSVGGEAGGGIERAMRSPSVIAGDTVEVWPGSISGGYDIKFPMKSGVVLLAHGYPDSVVIIDGIAGAEPAIRMVDCSEITEIRGFRITWDSQNTGIGGGIAAFVSSGVIRDNIFVNCRAGIGAGIHLQSSDILIENNLFLNNLCVSGGGVLSISGGNPTVRNNTFAGSEAPFGAAGAALFGAGSDFLFERNILYDSRGTSAVYCAGGNNPTIACNIFWANEVGGFGGQCPDSTGTSWNVNTDPLFCDPGFENFGVCADSPALTGPCGAIGYASPGGNCPPCQPTPVQAALRVVSWGRVKTLYR